MAPTGYGEVALKTTSFFIPIAYKIRYSKPDPHNSLAFAREAVSVTRIKNICIAFILLQSKPDDRYYLKQPLIALPDISSPKNRYQKATRKIRIVR